MNEEGEISAKKVTQISEIQPIGEQRGQMIKTRDSISSLVEPPLISACEMFWDNNIRTLESSANKNDIGRGASIAIDWESLSDDNRKIAKEYGKLLENYDGKSAVLLTIPVTERASSEDIEQEADKIAANFMKQSATWVPSYSLEEVRGFYEIDPDDSDFGIESFVNLGFYYDERGQKFYLSEEHFNKIKEL
jgi:hypothetical protein